MLRKLIFGQYSYKNTIIHKLDPRLKLLINLGLSIILFLIKDIKLLFITIFIMGLVLISKVRLKEIIYNLKPFYFIFFIILVMYLVSNKFLTGLIVVWRFLLLLLITHILLSTTSYSELVLAFEPLVNRDIAIAISTSIRFIPYLFLEIIKIRDTQLSRLTNFKKLKNIKLFIEAILRKMVNVVIVLTDSMIARCYRNTGYTRAYKLKFQFHDYIAALIIISLFILILKL